MHRTPRQRAQRRAASSELRAIRELPELSEPAARDEKVSTGLFQWPYWHRTHDSEPRRETQAESLQRSENYLSYQS